MSERCVLVPGERLGYLLSAGSRGFGGLMRLASKIKAKTVPQRGTARMHQALYGWQVVAGG